MNRKQQNNKDINSELKKQGRTPVQKKKVRWHLSVLTILLIVFVLQLAWGVLVNSFKIYSLNSKIHTLEKIDKVATRKNQYLREELEKYTSNSGVEALARNRLQFSKPDETLIIIKDNQNENENLDN